MISGVVALGYLAAIAPSALRWTSISDTHPSAAVTFGLPAIASVVAGLIIQRWSLMWLPTIPLVYVVARAIVDSTAGFEEGWGYYLFAVTVAEEVVLAATISLGGLARSHRVARRMRDP